MLASSKPSSELVNILAKTFKEHHKLQPFIKDEKCRFYRKDYKKIKSSLIANYYQIVILVNVYIEHSGVVGTVSTKKIEK